MYVCMYVYMYVCMYICHTLIAWVVSHTCIQMWRACSRVHTYNASAAVWMDSDGAWVGSMWLH